MEISLLSKDEKSNSSKFLITDTTSSFLNAIRKYALTKVKTLAIEEVEFSKNDSGLYDEMIALRLGLLPLKTDLSMYSKKDECECNGVGCSKCQAEFSIEKKGPCVVYASDIKFQDPSISVVYPKTQITKLFENQELILSGIAEVNIGKKHAKFSPCHLYYHNVFEIDMKESKVSMDLIKKYFNDDSYYKEGDILLVTDIKAYDSFSNSSDFDTNLKLIPNQTKYVLYLETFGQLDEKDILDFLIKELNQDIDNLKESFID